MLQGEVHTSTLLGRKVWLRVGRKVWLRVGRKVTILEGSGEVLKTSHPTPHTPHTL